MEQLIIITIKYTEPRGFLMFYHVAIETSEKDKKGNFQKIYETDQASLDDIKKYIIEPYLAENKVYVDDRFIDYKNIRKLQVFESQKSASMLADEEQSKIPNGMIGFFYSSHHMLNDNHMKNITKSLLFP